MPFLCILSVLLRFIFLPRTSLLLFSISKNPFEYDEFKENIKRKQEYIMFYLSFYFNKICIENNAYWI